MAANSALSAVTLRYWACRGRAEFIRCMLRDSGTAFSDEVDRRSPYHPNSKENTTVVTC
jgi:hypothetical protein